MKNTFSLRIKSAPHVQNNFYFYSTFVDHILWFAKWFWRQANRNPTQQAEGRCSNNIYDRVN